jgi:quinol monooxygenase YgiN
MAETIVYTDHSEIRPGKLEEIKSGIAEIVEFVRAHEPQLIFYAFYIDEVAPSMTVVAVHPDSASMEFHMQIGGPEFRKLADFIDLRLIEAYGAPSPTVLDQLDDKAQMLGENARVVVHERQAGFARFLSADP